HSFIGTDAFTFAGRVFGADNAVSSGAGNATGLSKLVLAFTLSAPTTWTAIYTNGFSPAPHTQTDVFGASMDIRNSSNVSVVGFDGFFVNGPQSGVLGP